MKKKNRDRLKDGENRDRLKDREKIEIG